MIKLGLMGSSGRMGRVTQTLLQNEYSSQIDVHSLIDQNSMSDPATLKRLLVCDAVVDFSIPQGLLTLIEKMPPSEKLPAFAIASTGWTPEEFEKVKFLSGKTPILHSNNFSTGIFIFTQLLETLSPQLIQMGYQPVLTDIHHQHKRDTPSGTAKTLQQAISPGHPERVQTHSIRAGEVIGEHTVSFFGAADSLSIQHRAQDRSLFARGAIEASLWLVGKSPGMYSMKEFVGERFHGN